MRGFLVITALLFALQNSFAQLSVKPSKDGTKSNYLYVKEDLLFVQKDIHLVKNTAVGSEASIYLRKNAGLLQGEGSYPVNSGNGSISIFQRGSTNAYDYNYWSAPVSAPENGLFGTSLLHAPQAEIKSNPALQTSALNGTAIPLTIATRWIYTFSGDSYSNWNFVGGNTAIPPGYGFTMKGTDGTDGTFADGEVNNFGNAQRFDFRGRPNSGTIEVPVTAGNFVLVGNPYPSAFDLSMFLLENSGAGTLKTHCYTDLERRNVTTGIAYFWDSKENGNSHYLEEYVGGYGAYSPVDPCTTGVYEAPIFKKVGTGEEEGKGRHFNPRYLQVGRGFMLQGVETRKVIFRNAHRSFQKEGGSAKDKLPEGAHKKHSLVQDPLVIPKIQLVVSINDEYERKLTVGFWNEATSKVDAGMDAEAFEIAPTDAGWLQDESSYVIDVRPHDPSAEIPLFLKVETQQSKVTFSKGFSENIDINNLFILDTQTNEYFSIKAEGYTLELQPGTYHGRFKLAFAEKVPQEILPQVFFEEEAVPVKFEIVQNNKLGELEIIGNDYFPVKSVGIFDMQGKRMLYRTNFDNSRSISIATGHWANAVYIVKVTGMDNHKTTKKISVYNR
ncbi:T9SS type A sorting domain-containing protein [Salinimicrobium sp. CDJ15-81-2]|nr:T9SS type A sorting domain-containing protein [Salinimicrobium nanhaiense]